MEGTSGLLRVEVLSPETTDYLWALNLACGGTKGDSPGSDPVDGLLAIADSRSLVLQPAVGIFCGKSLLGAFVAVSSPGGSAMVLHSDLSVGSSEFTVAAIRAASALLEEARLRGIGLVQVLSQPEDDVTGRVFSGAGFQLLTQLLYLRRAAQSDAMCHGSQGVDSWVEFAPSQAPLFEDTLAQTYVDTVDCAELAGIRTPRQALADHRAAGEFDPTLWRVAVRGQRPVGILLLSPLVDGSAIELVYLGVSQVARNSGVADALVREAVNVARKRGAKRLTLAVDRRNTPARRLYARWGFVQTGVRTAWIATPCAERPSELLTG